MIPTKTAGELVIPTLWIWTWGIWWKREIDDTQDEYYIQCISSALDLWYTHIDTAEIYGTWHSEKIIWKAIEAYSRDSLFLTSKVVDYHLWYDDVLKACENSLKRLWTSYLDLYLIHAPSDTIPLWETMRAFNRLVDEKMIRHIWVSNFTVNQIKEAQSHCDYKIANNQIEYSLITRNQWRYAGGIQYMESKIIPYCQQNEIIVTTTRPLERGLLAKPGHVLLDELAKKYDKTQAQIAINWIISQDNLITIPKSSSTHHLSENLWAYWWEMSKEDREKLDKAEFAELPFIS